MLQMGKVVYDTHNVFKWYFFKDELEITGILCFESFRSLSALRSEFEVLPAVSVRHIG